MLRKQTFRKKLKNRFKNCRRPLDNAVINRERDERGVVRKRKRSSEGMPGMCPPLKLTQLQVDKEAARYSLLMKQGEDVLQVSFPVRRKLLTATRRRKTTSQMWEMFPRMFSVAAVSS